MRRIGTGAWALIAIAGAFPLAAQDAPIGLAPSPLQDRSYVFDTAEEHGVRLTPILRFERAPYDLAFLPDGDLLVVQRGVDIRIVHGATTPRPALDPAPIAGVPKRSPGGEPFQIMDVALHPKFASNRLIYFSGNYLGPKGEGRPQGRIAVLRGRLDKGRLSGVRPVLTTDEVSFAGGSRLQFAPDGTLYIATGAPFGDLGQKLGSVYGKTLRINDDGSVPGDNPFTGRKDARPEVYSYGHRDQGGLTARPGTGQLFASEYGPNGGDEVNLLKPGANYGWPNWSYGRQYDGSAVSAIPVGPGIEPPFLVWVPSIAPTGLTFYQGDSFPAWKGNLFVAGGRRGEIDNTGGIERVVFNERLEEVRREMLFTDLRQRFRAIVEGPDGNLYALVERGANALVRIEPVAAR